VNSRKTPRAASERVSRGNRISRRHQPRVGERVRDRGYRQGRARVTRSRPTLTRTGYQAPRLVSHASYWRGHARLPLFRAVQSCRGAHGSRDQGVAVGRRACASRARVRQPPNTACLGKLRCGIAMWSIGTSADRWSRSGRRGLCAVSASSAALSSAGAGLSPWQLLAALAALTSLRPLLLARRSTRTPSRHVAVSGFLEFRHNRERKGRRSPRPLPVRISREVSSVRIEVDDD
jgi:hypothetical protein